MSNFQAIGGVSATLKALLTDRMELPGGVARADFQVTVGPPRPDGQDGSNIESPRVNLFLYRATENGCLKNQEIPGQGQRSAYGRPPLSLDLHYLLTAYGTTDDGDRFVDETLSHFLLGSAMRVLHDNPIITEQLRAMRDPLPAPVLDANLRGEFEHVKLNLEPLSLEDLSKVWTALTLPFRVAAAYQVTVVQIESLRARRIVRPVGEPPLARTAGPPPTGPRVFVAPFRHPQIAELRFRRPGDPAGTERTPPYGRVGDTLIIRGQDFGGEALRVRIGGLSIPVAPAAPDRIELTIPDDTIPGFAPLAVDQLLQPGAQETEVVIVIDDLPQTGYHSNTAVFMLVPLINAVTPSAAGPRRVTITGERLFLERLGGEILIGRAVIPKNLYEATPTPTQVGAPVPDTLPASPVQALVSGSLAPFPAFPNRPEFAVRLTIGADGPHDATLPGKPLTLDEAATFLQAALRGAPGGGRAFRGARVTVAGDRLIFVPGGSPGTVAITFANVSVADTTADLLKLTGGATLTQVSMSGELRPLPALTAAQPRVRLTVGAASATVTLASRPTTLANAASLLEAAILAAGFAGSRVATVGDQLLFIPGAAGNVRFDPVAGVDETTVVDLQLRARYSVRVRVNGAESIDSFPLELPP